MPLVKNVWVKLSQSGAAEVKGALDDVAARAKAVGAMDPTVKLSVDDKAALLSLAAMRAELRALSSTGNEAGLRDLTARIKAVGESADAPRVKLAALRLETLAVEGAAQAAAGAIGPGSAGGAAGGGGFTAALAGILGPAGIAAAAVAGLGLGVQGLIPDLVAAGLGVGAFGALAIPTITAVTGAMSTLSADTAAYKAAVGDVAKDQALQKIRADWQALTPAQAQAVRGLQSIQAEFDKMASQFAPKVLPIFNTLLTTIDKLLPSLLPFANAAAGAFGQLATQFSKFASSTGFHQFLDQLVKLTGPTIETIGTGLGRVAIAAGRLMLALANPNALRIAKGLLDGIAYALTGLAIGFTWATQHAITWLHDTAVVFDAVRHAVAAVGDVFAQFGIGIGKDFSEIAHWVSFGLDTVRINLVRSGQTMISWATEAGRAVMDVIRWFEGLPGRIISALAALGSMLYNAGRNAIQNLINGILSMAGAVGSAVASIASKVAGYFGLSPAVEGPLSGGGAPEIRGRHFAEAFAAGMGAGSPQVAAAAARLAGGAAMGPGYGPGGAGGGVLQLQVTGSTAGSGLDALFMSWLKNQVRIAGGDPRIFSRKVKLA